MSMRIITGSTGNTHVTSDDDRQFNTAIFGTGCYVLKHGEKFKATLVDNNTITISDGEIIMQGCHARLNASTTEDVTIDTGAVGKKRIDLICARYSLDTTSGYESVNLVVVKGTESTGTPSVPAISNNANLRAGDTRLDFALYKVEINGINIENVTSLFTPVDYLKDVIDAAKTSISTINSNLVANDYVITTDMWVSDSTNEDYPYKVTITSTKYKANGAYSALVLPNGDTPFLSEDELDFKNNMIGDNGWSYNGSICFWAKDVPTVSIKLRIIGED